MSLAAVKALKWEISVSGPGGQTEPRVNEVKLGQFKPNGERLFFCAGPV